MIAQVIMIDQYRKRIDQQNSDSKYLANFWIVCWFLPFYVWIEWNDFILGTLRRVT